MAGPPLTDQQLDTIVRMARDGAHGDNVMAQIKIFEEDNRIKAAFCDALQQKAEEMSGLKHVMIPNTSIQPPNVGAQGSVTAAAAAYKAAQGGQARPHTFADGLTLVPAKHAGFMVFEADARVEPGGYGWPIPLACFAEIGDALAYMQNRMLLRPEEK
jgi:hypothetical protein